MTEDSDLNGESPQFTITCVSTGGPVVCVTWKHNFNTIPDPVTTSALIDPVEGMYVHNLTVTEVAGGYYTCDVTNNKPFIIYRDIHVECKEVCVCVSV